LRPYAALVEEEAAESGEVLPVATIFLTNRECPWRCLMCDLWKNTLAEPAPPGAIAAQIRGALASLPPARQVKLYNAGSFFDAQAIRPEEHEEIAALVRPFERVIVESHPALVGDRCLRFRDLLGGGLEVALGLETVHPEVLPRLNKRMSLDDFRRAAAFLQDSEIALRVFVLVGLPFVEEREALDWACRSTHFAFDCGASAVSLIPTRAGNGALDALAERGEFAEPGLGSLESALDFGIQLGRGRVFADLWDLERFGRCADCLPARAARLRENNLLQTVRPRVACPACGGRT
jgi:radical SAM enzyme (TIGR01210 family)